MDWIEYWTELDRKARLLKPPLPLDSIKDKNWVGYCGSDRHASVVGNTLASWIRVNVVLQTDEASRIYERLIRHRVEIETDVGEGLVWEPPGGRQRAKIYVQLSGASPSDRSDRPRQVEWFLRHMPAFARIVERATKA